MLKFTTTIDIESFIYFGVIQTIKIGINKNSHIKEKRQVSYGNLSHIFAPKLGTNLAKLL